MCSRPLRKAEEIAVGMDDEGCGTDLPPQDTSVQPGEPLQQNPYQPTHPISKLPTEIMSEIFLHFLPAYPECPEHSWQSSPLLLCAICRKWRAIAIATPRLWRAIRMTVSNNSSVQLTAPFELLDTWLSRSGNCPLSFSIPYQEISRDSDVEAQLLEKAVLHSERWEQADLNLARENLHFLQCNMPLLQRLTFGLSDPYPSDAIPMDLFDCAPRLKERINLGPSPFETIIQNILR
ncbi:F-box domain-containing protein [Mycena sanguinolenta]|uniref:F-box domain-containing protein n=1 Tax=Mycena sanguinolenta TaxID=230812 RepID=A0A8H6U0M4_9AGAR|nr:F-box domain-containing protein [Mycena sanguinolenta]